MKISFHQRAHIGVLVCVAILSVFATVSRAQSASGYSVAQLKELKELPKSATITGAITKLNSPGITSPLAMITLDDELSCEISFPVSGEGKIKIEKEPNTLKVFIENRGFRSTYTSVFRTLSLGQTITVSGVFVRKGNRIKLTGQLVGR